ncbi:MAG: DUF3857 domain-containing protein, partial [Planctomycetota bacterium]
LPGAARLLEVSARARPFQADPCLERAELALEAEDRDAALAWLEEARARKARYERTTDLALLHRIRTLRGESWEHETHDLALGAVDAAAYTPARFPTANHATLLRVVVRRVYPDRSVESLVHTAVKVFDKDGIDALGELRLPENPDDLLYCRTILPDGRIFTPTNIQELDFSNASMYRVTPGSILEYAFREVETGGLGGDFRDRFWFEELNVPVARARYVLLLPPELEARTSVKAWPRDFPPRAESRGGLRTYTWDAENLAPVKPEPAMPDREEVLRNLAVHVAGPRYGEGARFFAVPAPLETNAAVQETARRAAQGLATDRERVRALHAEVRRLLKPAGGARTPRDALALQSGSPENAQDLLRALLDAVGIESWPAKANVGFDRAGPRAQDRNGAIDAFATDLLFIRPREGDPFWVRFFSPPQYFRPGDLGFSVPGSPALVRGPGGLVTLRRVRATEAERTPADVESIVRLAPDGSAGVEARIRFHGMAAGELRRTAELPQEGERRIERIALSLYPKLVLTRSEYPRPQGEENAGPPQEERAPFVYELEGSVAQFSRREGARLVFTPFPMPLGALPYLLAPPERRTDFVIRDDVETSQEARFLAPEGWAFVSVPESVHWQGEFGLYVMNFTVRGAELCVSRALILPAQAVKPWQYPTLARFVEACKRTERLSVSLAEMQPLGMGETLSETMENRSAELMDEAPLYLRWWPSTAEARPDESMEKSAEAGEISHAAEATGGAAE